MSPQAGARNPANQVIDADRLGGSAGSSCGKPCEGAETYAKSAWIWEGLEADQGLPLCFLAV
jgi:hypothetical protein